MKDTNQKFENLAAVSATTEKKALLKSYLNDPLFLRVVTMMFREDLSFGIKELPENSSRLTESPDTILDFLEQLAEQSGVTAKNKQALVDMCSLPSRQVVQRIVKGKSGAGFSATTINDIRPGTIDTTPYQRCSGIEKVTNINWPAICQVKMDGMFAYGCQEFPGVFKSRKGKVIPVGGDVSEAVVAQSSMLLDGHSSVLMGELTVIGPDGKTMSRKKSNGILNKCIKSGDAVPASVGTVVYTVWDTISYEAYTDKETAVPYEVRWDLVNVIIETDNLKIVESYKVDILQEALDLYEIFRVQGEEGAVVKDLGTTWKHQTSTTMVKLKHFITAELVITGVNEGQNDFTGLMGSLDVESSDGKVKASVGSGFKLDERSLDYWTGCMGDIVEVKFESLITAKGRDDYSLFLPTFVELRTDKTEADDLEYLKGLE